MPNDAPPPVPTSDSAARATGGAVGTRRDSDFVDSDERVHFAFRCSLE